VVVCGGGVTLAFSPAIPWPMIRRARVAAVHKHLGLRVNLNPKGCVVYGGLTLAFSPATPCSADDKA